ncbi:MAG: cytochrome c3 family protein [Armatimonadota bacterium]
MMRVVAFSLVAAAAAALALGSMSGGATSTVALNPNHECTYCHGLHGAPGSQLLNDTTFEALCLTCHGPSGTSILKADNHVYTNSTCSDCHVPHSNVTNWLGGTNIKLVRDSVDDPQFGGKRPVVFESRGETVGDPRLHSFCDGDQDGNGVWDGVCDTCHENTGRHRYTDPSSHAHQQGKTCTRSGCHEHVNRFKKR